jgi:hypothetical protein
VKQHPLGAVGTTISFYTSYFIVWVCPVCNAAASHGQKDEEQSSSDEKGGGLFVMLQLH